MLHGGGWLSELRSNRWHYAKFFSRHIPVIVAEAQNDRGTGTLVADSRIENVNILQIGSLRPLFDSPVDSAQIVRKCLAQIGAQRPLLWLSSPQLWNVAACLEDLPVVFHATEDYLRLAKYNPHPAAGYIRDCVVAASRGSDVILSCSAGVTESLKSIDPHLPIVTSSNGVSLDDYGNGRDAEPVEVEGVRLASCAIFAGNINKRLDYPLLSRVAEEISELTLLLVGPISHSGIDRKLLLELLQRENVRHLGEVSTEALNYLYQQCRAGIVPYLGDPVIVKSGFPLKTLEMAACGLTVISTHMDATHDLCESVICCHSPDEFVAQCRNLLQTNHQPTISSRTRATIQNFSYSELIPSAVSSIIEILQLERRHSRDLVRFRIMPAIVNTISQLKKAGFGEFVKSVRRVLHSH